MEPLQIAPTFHVLFFILFFLSLKISKCVFPLETRKYMKQLLLRCGSRHIAAYFPIMIQIPLENLHWLRIRKR